MHPFRNVFYSDNVQVIERSANVSDLNSIEKDWSLLKQKKGVIKNREEVTVREVDIWVNDTHLTKMCIACVSSMPK
jgi:hypothetical protein